MSPLDSFDEPASAPQEIERTAAGWVVRTQHGLTATEQEEFHRWQKQDERHAEIFAEMTETSRLLDQLRDPVLAGDPAPARWAPVESVPVGRWRKVSWIAPLAVGAAAAIVLAWVAVQQHRIATQPYVQIASTDIGGFRELNLPEGSRVQLNTDSAVEVDFRPGERRIRLTRGEAFFVVAKNSERPFWVDVGAVSVRAIGTAFNVRYRSETVEVLVKAGTVSVNQAPTAPMAAETSASSPAFDSRLVVAGEKAVIATAAEKEKAGRPIVVATIEPRRIESALAWQARRLEFADTPLSEVVAEFNRFNRHKLIIADPALAEQTFGGAFASNGHGSLVEVLEQSFQVVAERKDNETVLRMAR